MINLKFILKQWLTQAEAWLTHLDDDQSHLKSRLGRVVLNLPSNVHKIKFKVAVVKKLSSRTKLGFKLFIYIVQLVYID